MPRTLDQLFLHLRGAAGEINVRALEGFKIVGAGILNRQLIAAGGGDPHVAVDLGRDRKGASAEQAEVERVIGSAVGKFADRHIAPTVVEHKGVVARAAVDGQRGIRVESVKGVKVVEGDRVRLVAKIDRDTCCAWQEAELLVVKAAPGGPSVVEVVDDKSPRRRPILPHDNLIRPARQIENKIVSWIGVRQHRQQQARLQRLHA